MEVLHGSEFFHELLEIEFGQIMKYFTILVVFEKHFYPLRTDIAIDSQQTVLIKPEDLPFCVILFSQLSYLELLFQKSNYAGQLEILGVEITRDGLVDIVYLIFGFPLFEVAVHVFGKLYEIGNLVDQITNEFTVGHCYQKIAEQSNIFS